MRILEHTGPEHTVSLVTLAGLSGHCDTNLNVVNEQASSLRYLCYM